jgi:putative PIN family toxin of toxin-antitoxin system
MAKALFKVILDTNLWISYLISNRLISIDSLLEQGSIELLFSEESLEEFVEVAKRPKFRKFFSEEDLIDAMSMIGHFSKIVDVHSKVDVCRDAMDNFLLALAKDGRADFLVTGDKDLLDLVSFEGTQIVDFSTLERVLQ